MTLSAAIMACSQLCTCQFNWPMDTLGYKRDPITSEKAWLDFSVRMLSREAVGRGKGQETVWGSSCKPTWWDIETGLQWKNPTSNPKDSKDVLLKKYNALEKHLRSEGRFPNELEEEARLWLDGNQKELFLLTSLTSLLGKVSGVHVAVLDAKGKANKVKAKINKTLLQDIETCLISTLSEVKNICTDPVVHNPLKRKREDSGVGKENEAKSAKLAKKTPVSSPSELKNAEPDHFSSVGCKADTSGRVPSNLTANMVTAISNYSRKLISKHKDLKKRLEKVKTSVISNSPSSTSQIKSPTHTLVLKPQSSETDRLPINFESNTLSVNTSSSTSPICISINTPVSINSDLSLDNQDCFLQTSIIPLHPTSLEDETLTPQNKSIDIDNSCTITKSNQNLSLVTDSTISSTTNDPCSDLFIDPGTTPVGFEKDTLFSYDSLFPDNTFSEFLSNGDESNNVSPNLDNFISIEALDQNLPEIDEMESSDRSLSSRSSTVSQSGQKSDQGYNSDDSTSIDLDHIFSLEGLTQLFEEDLPLVTDTFLNELD